MAKKGLFGILRRIFVSEVNTVKNDKRRKWTFWRIKIKKMVPSITAPSPPPPAARDRIENEAKQKQSKHDVTNVADVVQNVGGPELDRIEHTGEYPVAKTEIAGPPFEEQIFRKNQIEELAAVKIQTAFRGYLARKALRALKEMVKLQAYIRGKAVRRQAMTSLKCLQSVVSIQSQVCARRTQISGGADWHSVENKDLKTLRDKIIKVDTKSQRRWDNSLLTKEEAEAMIMSKKEDAIKREQIREYIITHRKSAESYQTWSNTRFKCWLNQWVDTQLSKSKELEDLDFSSNPKPKAEIFRDKQLKIPAGTSPRKLIHHRSQFSVEQGQNLPFQYPVVMLPTYMAATDSAKAKARSLRSTRVRPGNFDTQSESYFPYKRKICRTSSITSEAPSRVRGSNDTTRASACQQRSPGLRGYDTAPVKSNRRTLKDISFDSECSLPNWNRQSGLG